MARGRGRLNPRTVIALCGSAAWSVALLVGAATLHVNQTTQFVGSLVIAQPATTFEQANGAHGMLLLAVPLAATALMTLALWRRPPASIGPGPAALTVLALLAVFAILGVLTIGPYVVPAAAGLALACVFSETGRPVGAREPTVGPRAPRQDRN